MQISKEIINIPNSFTGSVLFSAEIECKPDELPSVKFGLRCGLLSKHARKIGRAHV